MMIGPWEVYFISKLDDIRTLLWVFFAFSFVSILFYIYVFFKSIEEKEPFESLKCKKFIYFLFAFCLISFFSSIFIPSTKEAVAIYLIPKIANSQEIKELPKQLYSLTEKLLDDHDKNEI